MADFEDGISFPQEVEDALNEVITDTDQLDGKDFNPVDYINTLFPSEQSLANIDDVVLGIRSRIRRLDDEIRDSIRKQADTVSNGKQALEEAKEAIHEVFGKIKEIKEKADESEDKVKEITRDIKQLDHGKRHLTSSITTLNHLHMLVGGVDSLVELTKRRQYDEIANLLQGVLNVLDHFKKYIKITQIKDLADKVNIIQDSLNKQIMEDFKKEVEEGLPTGPNSQLANACKVVSILDPKFKLKENLLNWFIKKQLGEYLIAFDEAVEAAWIDKIDRRYSWMKQVLVQFEKEYANTFPTDWALEERICIEFCTITKKELESIMGNRSADIDVKLLLFAIQRTTTFETFMAKRFAHSHLKALKGEGNDSYFHGMVSKCFENHLYIYIEAQDKNLAELIEKFTSDLRTQGVPKLGEDAEGTVLPSAGELFVFYKKCMVQCIQLSTGRALLDLTDTFRKYLVEYANRILMGNLPKVSNQGGLSSLLKDQEVKFTEEEKRMICCILTTAEYCQETTQQLQDKLQEKIDTELSDKITMNAEQDQFHLVITNSIQLLVQDLENNCEPALTAMSKVHWQSIETVGDQSGYVTAIVQHLHKAIPLIRNHLYSSRKYFAQFCIKFVNSFIPRFINNIYKCKPLPPTGAAEQLLLDTHSIKTVLLGLPTLGSSVQRKPTASFTKVVQKGMSKAEMILKVVMSSHEKQTKFVENYITMLSDGDVNNFQKILDMKGMRRSEQHTMLEIFRTQMVSHTSGAETIPEATTAATDSSRIKRLEKLIKKQF